MSIKAHNASLPVFFIRCDSSAVIGSGHVMRCLNLAQHLRDNGAEVIFLSRPLLGNVSDRIVKAGFALEQITIDEGDSDYAVTQPHDAQQTLSYIAGRRAVVIVDHYGLKADWQKEIRKTCFLAVIDDLADRAHECDLLVNQNFYPEGRDLYKALVNEDAFVAAGPAYALISPRFGACRPPVPAARAKVKRIVIFFGASDMADMTRKSLQATALLKEKPERIDVVIGINHPGRDALKTEYAQNPHISFFDHIDNFAKFLVSADLLIAAGGVTQLERCCLGIPGIIIAIADNQMRIAENLSGLGAALYLGWHENVDESILHAALRDICPDHASRMKMAEISHRLVDGRGVKRVAALLLGAHIRLKPATMEDAEDLRVWRNHPEVRKTSYNTNEIPKTNHLKWLQTTLASPDRALMIAHWDGQPLGVLRFDYQADIATVSVYLVPDLIGRGMGAALICAGTLWIQANKPGIRAIRAQVRDDNPRSARAFTDAGYRSTEECYEYNIRW